MAYRGEDLDLRTPQTWNVAPVGAPATADPYLNGTRGRIAGYGRGAQPILVDDVVLACSNHAFDVAVAHRASEVRLEHLLHAMTRIDTAANALDARGIRVAGLRRESATIIASEIPIGLGAGQGRPRRSDDLESALRAAAEIAWRRNGPANVDDVLDALLDMPSDVPGIALLARHGGRVARDRSRPRDPQPASGSLPLPPLSRPLPQYVADPIDAGRDRIARPAPAAYQGDLSRPVRTDLVGTPTDGIQNARIDQLENAVRSLTGELANERSLVSGLVQDLQRSIKSERDDTSRFRGGLHDRLQSLEQAVLSSGDDGAATQMIDRLAAVERGIEQRLGDLSRPWGVLSDRLQALEQTVLDTRGTKGGDITGMMDRFAGLERAIRDTAVEGNRDAAALADRMKTIERSLDAFASRGPDLSPIANRLDIIEEAVLGADTRPENDKLLARLQGLEDTVAGLKTVLAQSNQSLANDLKALTTALAAQAANTERSHAFVTDRMQMLASGFERQRAELTGPMVERLTAIDGRMQAQFGPFAERLRGLEARVAESMQKNAEATAAHTAELREVHEALIKLNTNQHTLAGSIDQWRLDGVGDISVIAKQLETLQTATARPAQMIEQMSASIDSLNKVTIERYHRRNRFWYWLFGTDDWLTASWPSQVANIEAERAALRGSSTVPKVAAVPPKTVPSRTA